MSPSGSPELGKEPCSTTEYTSPVPGSGVDYTAPLPPEFVPPNGGTLAWLQVLSGFFCTFNSWGIQTTFGAFLQYYETDLLPNETPMQLAWIGALSSCLTTLGCVIFAPVLDAGYLRPLLFAGSIVTTFGLMMLSLCKTYWQIMICQGLIVGLGTSILFLCGVGSIPPWFTTRRSVAMGIAVSGSSIGGVIYPIMLRRLIAEIGFGWAARILGFMALVLTQVSFAIVRRHAPPKKSKGVVDLTAATEPGFMLYSMSLLLGFMAYFATIFYAQSYGVSQFGSRNGLLYYTTTIINAASTLGRTFVNYTADKVGPFNAFVPCLAISTVVGYCWLATDSTLAGFWVVIGIYGFSSAPLISLMSPICAKHSPDMSMIGRRIGFVSVFGGIGIILGAPMGGILQSEHGWQDFKIYSATLMAGACLLALGARIYYSKGKLIYFV